MLLDYKFKLERFDRELFVKSMIFIYDKSRLTSDVRLLFVNSVILLDAKFKYNSCGRK
jgi:hypothetical protein